MTVSEAPFSSYVGTIFKLFNFSLASYILPESFRIYLDPMNEYIFKIILAFLTAALHSFLC